MNVGDALPPLSVPVTRQTLLDYAAASGDDNVIHQDEEVAKAVGLPDVIAHGMLTMALAGRVVTAFAGDPGRVEALRVRFSRPVVVPADGGAVVTVRGAVEELLEDGRVKVGLTATVDETKVLMGAYAVVRLPSGA
ncbi:MAG: dehydratase [Frankiales bacterium]|nr:dehydratase [Frankiales bacterium]